MRRRNRKIGRPPDIRFFIHFPSLPRSSSIMRVHAKVVRAFWGFRAYTKNRPKNTRILSLAPQNLVFVKKLPDMFCVHTIILSSNFLNSGAG
jgi:hypothetical protein